MICTNFYIFPVVIILLAVVVHPTSGHSLSIKDVNHVKKKVPACIYC